MRRYAARLGYEGTSYYGFQRQTNVSPTIQGELEAALARIAGRDVPLTVAGRTDAGVHASGQVVTFEMAWSHPLTDLRRAWNAYLPESIAVFEVWEPAPDFHPRFSATARRYVYRLYQAPVRDPLRRNRAWHLRNPLDVHAIRQAAAALPGHRDYGSFGHAPEGGENTTRLIYSADWAASEGGGHTFTICGNAFLYRMVRRIVGTLVDVGWGNMTPEAFIELVETPLESPHLPLAPPHGLTLAAVEYNSYTKLIWEQLS